MLDTVHTDPQFGGYEYNIQMPVGQTFLNSGNCSQISTVRFHCPPGQLKPILLRDTLGQLLKTTVSLTSAQNYAYMSKMTMRGGNSVSSYRVSGSTTVTDDPSKYLMELRADKHVPLYLDMNLGLGSAWLDLSDMQVVAARIVSAAADVFISYKRPNRVPMKRMEVNGGMAKIVLRNLEYARAESVVVENTTGETKIIVGDKVANKCKLEVEVGTGSCTLLAHEDVPIRLLLHENVFSSCEVPDDFVKTGENQFVNLAYKRNAQKALTVIVDLGLGTFSLITYK